MGTGCPYDSISDYGIENMEHEDIITFHAE